MVKKRNLPPTTLVIFGISGDLAGRYILPALAELKKAQQLPSDFKILGLSRRQLPKDEVLSESTSNLADHLATAQLDMDDPAAYQSLQKQLGNDSQLVFYFAVPPPALLPIIKHL